VDAVRIHRIADFPAEVRFIMLKTYTLRCPKCVTPHKELKNVAITVQKDRISSLASDAEPDFTLPEGTVLYPALINIHDHLRGNYIPRVGPPEGTFYLNWSFWDKDLKASPVYQERAHISVDDMYMLGAYKNLFSGVVTVNDHFPHEINNKYIPRLPLRVIKEYTLAHECSSYDLKWGDGIEIEYKRALKKNYPFITHLEEGFDDESQDGIGILERSSCLSDHTVLIHCIGFSDEDIQKVRRAQAHVAWCPGSNMFMFNATCKIRKLLKAGVNVSIGTDSTHTGSFNLLEEMRYARETYFRLYGETLSAKTICDMVTINPAKAFRMDDRIGSIDEGKLADFLVLRENVKDPYENLLGARMQDIELLVRDGSPLLGSSAWEELFKQRKVRYNRITIAGREMLVTGDPRGLMQRVQKLVGFPKTLAYMPLEIS